MSSCQLKKALISFIFYLIHPYALPLFIPWVPPVHHCFIIRFSLSVMFELSNQLILSATFEFNPGLFASCVCFSLTYHFPVCVFVSAFWVTPKSYELWLFLYQYLIVPLQCAETYLIKDDLKSLVIIGGMYYVMHNFCSWVIIWLISPCSQLQGLISNLYLRYLTNMSYLRGQPSQAMALVSTCVFPQISNPVGSPLSLCCHHPAHIPKESLCCHWMPA